MFRRTRAEWLAVLESAPGVMPIMPEEIYDQGNECVRKLQSIGFVYNGCRILDIGCGNGRLAIPLTGIPVRYTGADVAPSCISFCQSAFHPWKNFFFEHLDIRSALYFPEGHVAPERVTLPAQDSSFDLVLASSLFTHFETLSVCEGYVEEILRVLRPGGHLFSTWFRSPPNVVSSSMHRTVFREEAILGLFRNFHIVETWGGETMEYHDQWCVCVSAGARRIGSPDRSSA